VNTSIRRIAETWAAAWEIWPALEVGADPLGGGIQSPVAPRSAPLGSIPVPQHYGMRLAHGPRCPTDELLAVVAIQGLRHLLDVETVEERIAVEYDIERLARFRLRGVHFDVHWRADLHLARTGAHVDTTAKHYTMRRKRPCLNIDAIAIFRADDRSPHNAMMGDLPSETRNVMLIVRAAPRPLLFNQTTIETYVDPNYWTFLPEKTETFVHHSWRFAS